jgi:hypothetical protein
VIEQDLTPVDLPPPSYTPAPPPSAGLSDLYNAGYAAYEAQRLDGDMFARRNALSKAIDQRNGLIQAATGEALHNPYEGGYADEAKRRLSNSEILSNDSVGDFNQPGVVRPFVEDRMKIWQGELDRLAQQYPDKADLIGAGRPILQDAKQLSDYWVQRAAKGEPGLNAVAGLAAGFVGGGVGFLANPANLGMMLATGGEAGVGSLAATALKGAAREALVNAGMQAAAEPGAQSWRAERGQESGLVPALKDIAEQGLFGAGLGAGFPLAKAGLQKLWRQALDHGLGITPALPENRAIEPASPMERDSVRFASLGDASQAEVQSGAVSPEVALATAARVDGDAEQLAVMRGAMASEPRGPNEAAEAVSREMEARSTPSAVAALRGAEPAEALPKPTFHRQAESDFSSQTEALRTEISAAEPPPVTVGPKRGVKREFPSLFEALAGEGGLAPHSELSAIFDGNPFVPGFGRLMREGGRTLDEALTAAKELGYLRDPADHASGEAKISVNDLLDKLRQEAHGEKVHSFRDAAAIAERDAARQSKEFERAVEGNIRALKKDKSVNRSLEPNTDEWLLRRAAEIMGESGDVTPHAAYERAVIDYEDRLLLDSSAFDALHQGRINDTGEIPGWDIPFDRGEVPIEYYTGDAFPADAGAASPGGAEGAGPHGETAGKGGGAEAAGGGPRGAGEPHRGPLDLLDAAPDENGRPRDPKELAQEQTREQMLATVVERCPF